LRSFARKNLQTVENDREKFSGPLSLRGKYYAADCIGLIANDCAEAAPASAAPLLY
jgi:hypothetical protein